MVNNSISADKLLEQLEFLFENYSNELRATTQPYILARQALRSPGFTYTPDNAVVRETLMEHVGSLPVVATTFFPYINDHSVDLGQALIMLAIYDIGELITGDEMTFTKQADAKDPEYEAALSLLHESYHTTYDEVEKQINASAKYAKSIDKITPDIIDYLTPPEITVARYKHYVGIEPNQIVPLVRKHKQPYMVWNPFMANFHDLLLKKIDEKLKSL